MTPPVTPHLSPVIFLFNHDTAHQVAHSAGIAGAAAVHDTDSSRRRPIIAATGGAHIRAEIEKLLTPAQMAALQWIDLSLPLWLHWLLAPLNRFVPVRRLGKLYWHRKALRKAAIIVSTERTCLTLKRHWDGLNCPSFILINHGAGDRNVSAHPAFSQFDLCLLSGQKVVDQFVAAGASTPEKCRIIGYAKFDILRGRKPERFFDNDRPTFLYNPHFDPHMSSWFDQGDAIIRYFYERPDRFNLIFAPHVMLFQKKTHISPEFKVAKNRPEIAKEFFDAPNILIDTDGPRLFDMSYTFSADAYIGDVSSQVYEFLYRPRACFFVDVHSNLLSNIPAGDAPAYDFWNNGPIVQTAAQLSALLPNFQAIAEQYRAAQVTRMAHTADNNSPLSASVRGAQAIMEYFGRKDG